ncbi:MAG: SpoIIE family protein phosphatase [Deltaproteobacteria bacterium]|nr:SpoIIE family protein phosphatase [Deltaproteobacteria bacterium]
MVAALADGLGHGPMAEEASLAFCEYVKAHPTDDLEDIIRDAGTAIAKTRGVAAAVVRIDLEKQSISFAGIGNIELQSVSKQPIRPVCTPGIIGRPLRKVVQFDYELNLGDLLAMYSDGISSRFSLSEYRYNEVQAVADTILANHGKAHDDATCIVFRF